MRQTARCLSFLFTAVLLAGPVSPASAQSTAFTYQGSLDDGGAPASGLHDFRFRLFSVASGGTPIGSTLCMDNVSVVEGVFTVQLDFGQQFATTGQRHLEIDVRRDTGLNCGSAAGFVLMSPRQQLTATPMASHANSAFALDAADGSPASAVFVDNSGNVGIGTTNPSGKLDIQGSDNSNVLFGRRTGGGLTHNLFIDGQGNGSMQLRDSGGTTRINIGSDNSTYFDYGDVGIGTTTPAAKLDVRGDIKLGPAGELQATSGEERLRFIRGAIAQNGGVIAGSGFTVAHIETSRYRITFTTPFASVPVVTATAHRSPYSGSDGFWAVVSDSATTGRVDFLVRNVAGQWQDHPFDFIAIGPR